MSTASVRYIVHDVEEAVGFYTGHLGFEVETQPGPGFAILARGALRLLLNSPGGGGGAARAMPDGRLPEPGGWNRIQLEVERRRSLRQPGRALRAAAPRMIGGRLG
jgi:catechol 2,3-dioxygenase-like lactoylglutathione lyase family enzyme